MKAEEFKEIREGLGWTQERMAKELGVTIRTITNYENGHSPISKTIDILLFLLMAAHKEDI